jgi:hypothetical protein
MIKGTFKGNEGDIKYLAFMLFRRRFIIALSQTKWHEGEKYKRAPIWVSTIGDNIPSLFIWKLAIGFDNRKKHKNKFTEL